jgi:hypothetical protein
MHDARTDDRGARRASLEPDQAMRMLAAKLAALYKGSHETRASRLFVIPSSHGGQGHNEMTGSRNVWAAAARGVKAWAESVG